MLEIKKFSSDDIGIYLKSLSDTRIEMVGKLRDWQMIDEEIVSLMHTKNSCVARYGTSDSMEENDIKFKLLQGLEIDNNVKHKYLYAHSRINELDHPLLKYLHFVTLLEQPVFHTLVLNNKGEKDIVWDRKFDTEAKILEDIYKDTYQLASGGIHIDMFTKYHPCESCIGVMEQFSGKMQENNVNVIINVYYEIKSSKQSRLKRGQIAL
ncbi:deaminase domain-containing protein [Paenibacillus amylolyticus]|uniref:deaminase domain-containing protein n=1 Tax=Paenibacillus amylolyticus TaxID=1451 RepID=UPI003D9997A5